MDQEVLQISLGSTANAVTAHLVNLQGLAATSNDDEEDNSTATCHLPTTHRLERHCWVPRVLFVDEPTRFFAAPQVSSSSLHTPSVISNHNNNAGAGTISPFSAFAIEPLDADLQLHHEASHWDAAFFQTANQLAYSSHSRYYQEDDHRPTYHASTSNPRHVVWDDNEEEEEEHEVEEEDPRERHARLVHEKNHWKRQTEGPLQHQLDQWTQMTPDDQTSTSEEKTKNRSRPNRYPQHWMDMLAPPYSERSKLALPYSSQSTIVSNWDAYPIESLKDWKEDVLLEEIRRSLEDCDSCQSLMVTTQGYGAYAGLTTAVLEEFQQEVKSAGRFVIHIDDDTHSNNNNNNNKGDETEQGDENAAPTSYDDNANLHMEGGEGWQAAHIDRLRRNMGRGLALQDYTEHAHLVLPVALNHQSSSLFQASAELAMALESVTLPFRFQPRRDPRYQVGLMNAPFFGQGGGDDLQWGTTAQRLSFHEWIMCLQPSSQYKLLELDCIMMEKKPSIDNGALWGCWKAGTSVERDLRMREGRNSSTTFRQKDVAPGTWLQSTHKGGILSSMTPAAAAASLKSSNNNKNNDNSVDGLTDRSLHHHFALSTSARPILQDSLSNYLTCLVQGMGILYRPERSVATVVDQTVGRLTESGYAAGAYWKNFVQLDTPTVSVVGNTTRIYPYLNMVAKDMKTALGPRYRGYYNRDMLNGVLPESEDCQEALAGCWDIRDTYLPPEGSGLFDDDGDGDVDY